MSYVLNGAHLRHRQTGGLQGLLLDELVLHQANGVRRGQDQMTAILQDPQMAGVHEFVFERDDVHLPGEFEQSFDGVPISHQRMCRECGGGAEGVALQHDDIAAELQRGHGRHAGQLAAAHDAEPRANRRRRRGQGGLPQNFCVVSFVHFSLTNLRPVT